MSFQHLLELQDSRTELLRLLVTAEDPNFRSRIETELDAVRDEIDKILELAIPDI